MVTDLDGTLWDAAGRVHPRTSEALDLLARAGVPVLAATGRRASSTWPLMRANSIALPAVVLDGAMGREFESAEAFHRRGFDVELAARTLSVLEELGVSPCVNVDASRLDVVVGARPSTSPAHLQFLAPWLRDEDPWTAVRTLPILGFSLAGGDPALLRAVADEVTGRLPVEAAVHLDRAYGGAGLSVRPLGVHKWAGVVAYCESRGLDPTRVLAIGDADNDLELLEAAQIACAIADGSPRVLELADHVLEPAVEGGWAAVPELLGLGAL